MGDGENFFSVLNKKNRIMSTCQYQSTRYQTYNRDLDPKSENYGSYTSSSECVDPEINHDGLLNTERNRQTIEYHRNLREYTERVSDVGGYLSAYQYCEEGETTECTVTPAIEHSQGDGFQEMRADYWRVPAKQGPAYKFNAYGRENAAFARIHPKEGNDETGLLKIKNPPNLFGLGGRGYNNYIRSGEGRMYHVIVNNQHDEKSCALGIDQFCQTKRNSQQFLSPKNPNAIETDAREEFAEESRRGGYDTDTLFDRKKPTQKEQIIYL